VISVSLERKEDGEDECMGSDEQGGLAMSTDNNTGKAQFGSISIGGNVGGNVTVQQVGEDVVGGNKVITSASGQAAEITDMNQLRTKDALEAHYALLSDKITALRKALILETDAATKFKLTHQIDAAETLLQQIEQRLEDAKVLT
jgi:hypothetical protein